MGVLQGLAREGRGGVLGGRVLQLVVASLASPPSPTHTCTFPPLPFHLPRCDYTGMLAEGAFRCFLAHNEYTPIPMCPFISPGSTKYRWHPGGRVPPKIPNPKQSSQCPLPSPRFNYIGILAEVPAALQEVIAATPGKLTTPEVGGADGGEGLLGVGCPVMDG